MKLLTLKIWRFLRTVTLSVTLVSLLALWALRSDWVQNWATKRIETLLENAVGAEVEIGGLDFDLPAKLVVRNFSMKDQQGQPMFGAGEVRLAMATFSVLDLIRSPDSPEPIDIKRLDVLGPSVNIYKSRSDSSMNIDFLSGTSTSDEPSKPPSLAFNAPEIIIQGGRFSYVDSTRSDSVLADRSKMNFSNLAIAGVDADLAFFMAPVLKMAGEIRSFQAQEEHSAQYISRLEGKYSLDLGPDATGGFEMCLEDASLAAGPQTRLDFDAGLNNALPDSLEGGFFPAFTLNLRPSTFEFAALNAFVPKPLPMQDPAQIEGLLFGDLSAIYSRELHIGLYDKTRIETSLALKNFTSEDDLDMQLGMAPSQVSFDELRRFLPGVNIPLEGTARVDGLVDFDLKTIYSRDLHIRYGAYTDLHVRTRLTDYSTEDLLMDFRLLESSVDFEEVLQLMPGIELPPWLAKFERGRVAGRFLGGPKDFVVDAQVKSSKGNVNGNLHLELLKGGLTAYEGRLVTENLNLDALGITEDVQSGNLNFDGYVKGKGGKFGEMQTEVSGKIRNSELMGYKIDLIQTKDVKIDSFKIDGAVELKDAQGNASARIELYLPKGGGHRYNVFGDVENLDLDHYGLVPGDSILLTSILNFRLTGDSIENYEGKLRFFEINMRRQGADSLKLRNVRLTSKFLEAGRRLVKLKSSLADMDMEGQFRFSEAIKVASRLGTEINLYLRNNDTLISKYYAEKVVVPENVSIRDTLITKRELNDVFAFFRLPVHAAPGTKVILGLDHGHEDVLQVELESDSIAASSVGMVGNRLNFDLIKYGDRNEMLLSGQYNAAGLWASKNIYFKNFYLEPEGDDKELDIFVHFVQPGQGSSYRLRTTTMFLRNGEIQTFILPANSLINIKGKEWKFSKGNKIVRRWERPPSMDPSADSLIDRFHVENLKLSQGNQEIDLEGVVSSDETDELDIFLREIRIGEILEISEQPLDIDGVIDSAGIGAWNLLSGQPSFYGGGTVKNFRYSTLDSLDIRFDAGWPYLHGPDFAGANVRIDKAGLDHLEVNGYYRISQDSLNFDAEPSKFALSWFEPFMEGEVTDLEGRLFVPRLQIRGTTKEPRLTGEAYLQNAGLRIDYLNNFFRLGNNKLIFNEDVLEIPRLVVRDTFGGAADLRGNLSYPKLAQLRANFLLDNIKDLTVLDTRRGMNSDFYGRIVLKGDSVRIQGPLTRLQMEAKVNTSTGTWLDIPLDNYTSASRLDFVQFVAGGKAMEIKESKEITGIGMEVTVQANPDARMRLILNEQAGDIIEARGSGAITLRITEQGEFTMSGVYTLEEGDYLFTAENIVNKRFEVRPGGSIFFNGDPYNADLNLDAVYKVNADISDLLPGQTGRVPVDIVMHMTGSLEEPNIKLELQIDELNQQDVMGLASYFRRIEYDEQELNKQVVSLLLFRRFSGATAGNNNAGSGVTSSISELISNQLNYWISQAFQDANLGLEVNTNQFQDVELAVRTSLFNNRVTVERNGAIISNQNKGVTLGDLSVQVKLLPRTDSNNVSLPGSGQLVMEIFNREDASLNAATNITRGVGLFYKKDFDRIPELFRRVKKKGKGKKEE